MKFTQFNSAIKQACAEIYKTYPVLNSIVNLIVKQKGRVILVGGAVRDILLGIPFYDLDCQVHGLTAAELERILSSFGYVDLVGKSFGVFRLSNLDVDWSLPRSDSSGRKPEVAIDPFMPIKDSFARRDVTINAIGIDLHTQELIDPFHGVDDLLHKRLRSPDITKFDQDPLRFFRVMQFIGRFECVPDEQLTHVCKTIDLSTLSLERIAAEYEKLFLKSVRPSLGFRWLYNIGRLSEILPELAQTRGIPQNPVWHPEGDVFEHTMQTVDAAAALAYDNEQQKLLISFAALCHDLGKITATKKYDGVYKSIGHETQGLPFAKKMLRRMTNKKELIRTVLLLVANHMKPLQFITTGAHAAAYKRLAALLYPQANIHTLLLLCQADKRGRNGANELPLTGPVEGIRECAEKARQAGVLFSREEPIIQGRDLLAYIQPGPAVGIAVKKAYKIQINKGITDKQALIRRVLI